jgi:hypothetical protein
MDKTAVILTLTDTLRKAELVARMAQRARKAQAADVLPAVQAAVRRLPNQRMERRTRARQAGAGTARQRAMLAARVMKGWAAQRAQQAAAMVAVAAADRRLSVKAAMVPAARRAVLTAARRMDSARAAAARQQEAQQQTALAVSGQVGGLLFSNIFRK